MTPGQPNCWTLKQGWKVRMLAGWGRRPTSLRSLSPFPGRVRGGGMRKIGRMSSRLVTATRQTRARLRQAVERRYPAPA
jgi:hypothetical protein